MGSFLDACGATGPLYWVVEHPGAAAPVRLVLDQPFLIVGRDSDTDLCLRHPDIGGRHAYFQLAGGRLFCLDLGSRTGIRVDGRSIRASWIDPRATIRVGPYLLRLDCESERERASESVETPGLNLELAHRLLRTTTCSADAALVLAGSAEDCQARLLDASVAGYHCSLVTTQKGTWAVNLGGGDSLAINGAAARVGRLYEEDVLRLGGSSIRLRREAAMETEAGHPEVAAPITPVDLGTLVAGLPPEQAELARNLLAPLVNQLGALQQHMFDRLQQAEHERFRALAALQYEQFGAIRDELDQLRELRQELDEIHGALRAQGRSTAMRGRSVARPRLGSAAPATGASPGTGAPALEPPDVLRLSVGEAS